MSSDPALAVTVAGAGGDPPVADGDLPVASASPSDLPLLARLQQ